MASHRLALPALILASIISGTGSTAVKLALRYFDPFTLLFLRLILASSLLLLSSFLIHQFSLVFSKRILLASILFTNNLIFFTLGMNLTTAISAGILVSLVPINLAILTHWRRKSEPVSTNQWAGLCLGLIGAFIIIIRSFNPDGHVINSVGTPLGNLFILVGVSSYSLYLYLNQPLTRRFSPFLLTTYNSSIAALVTLPLFLWANSRHTTFTQILHLPAVSILIFIVLILSIGMYLLYQWGIKHTSSLTAGTTIYLSPLVSAAVAIPILGERLTPHLLFGGSAILIGVYLANRKPKA